jgi:nitrogen fixation/metabolism regulation signal transduction histidine kinase
MERWLDHFALAAFRRSADTAHDLKTPLNVSVLNLELLRMRVRKLIENDDEKVVSYARSVELELRRMAQIFDAFFIFSVPPKNEGPPEAFDIAPIVSEAASTVDVALGAIEPATVIVHPGRIRQALRMFCEGIVNLLDDAEWAVEPGKSTFKLRVSGTPRGEEFELTKVFKFYYTDASGNPDLDLATARLIAETYGGSVEGVQDGQRVSFEFSLPVSEE